MIKLMLGDCLERMKEIESGSVDLILCDLPYGTMDTDGGRKIGINGWDIVIDTDSIHAESNRILRKNGKMVLFSQEPFTSELISKSLPNLPFNQRLSWEKDSCGNMLSAKKACVNFSEDILLFSKMHQKHDFEGCHPLRLYFKRVMEFIGLNLKQINNKLGHRRAEHTFYIDSTQYGLCTKKTYNELIRVFKINALNCFVEFDKLKEIDLNYRTELLRKMNEQYPSTFNLWEGNKFKSNILKYKKDYNGYHPTQKPVLLLEDLIKTYSNEGDLVVDMTMGSGSTPVACVNTKRDCIGIELDEGYFNIAQQRINDA